MVVTEARGIVLYDHMAVNGGAEKLTQALLRFLPPCDLCVGSVNREAFPELVVPKGQLVNLEADSLVAPLRVLRLLRAFQRHGPVLDAYDWALFSGVYAPVAAVSRSSGRNALYCHSIPRFCFDLRDFYMNRTPWIARPLLAWLANQVATSFEVALGRMDVIIANSENVRQALLQHFGVRSTVVHPPVDTERFRWISDDGYYISLGRLEPLKRVDVVIEAFRRMPGRRLVVTSGGSELQRLMRHAAGAPNIMFTGWLNEAALHDTVGKARAAIYVPVNEDFGMSPVEAMSAGKPVLGVAEGGLLETVTHGETGYLIDGELTPEAICDAIEQMERWPQKAVRDACEERAAAFGEADFERKMLAALANLLG